MSITCLFLASLPSQAEPKSINNLVDPTVEGKVPTSPELTLTPGELCKYSKKRRYPERIAYCERNVSRDLKSKIFINYDKRFGYQTTKINRSQFKIDHLIPLCAGGSNSELNLWPQHQSIYKLTDPLEPRICELMANGKLLQIEAVEIILEAKEHPERAEDIFRSLQ